jgi:hypothetical protein
MKSHHWAMGAVLGVLATVAVAQEGGAPDTQANNPLSNMKAVSLHNYYMGDLSRTDKTGDQFWLRFAQPFKIGGSQWLMRASLPVNSMPVGDNGSRRTGVGDFTALFAYTMDTGNPAVSFGVGPVFTLPTASRNELGSNKWSAGLVNVYFNGSSPKMQYGYLATWQHSFAGSSGYPTVNVASFQPMFFYQLGGGTYLRSSPNIVYDLHSDNYVAPIGLGIGQVIKRGNTVFNLFVEPQVAVAHQGPGQPKWQVFMGFNMQFKN